MSKTERIYIRVSPEEKEALQKNADMEKLSLSSYIRAKMLKEIEPTSQLDWRTIKLYQMLADNRDDVERFEVPVDEFRRIVLKDYKIYEIVQIRANNREEWIETSPTEEEAIREAIKEWDELRKDENDKRNNTIVAREVKFKEIDGRFLEYYRILWTSDWYENLVGNGRVKWQGKEIALMQGAYLSGTYEDYHYEAKGMDMTGQEYIIEWDTTDEWDALPIEDRLDVEKACNWDKPARVMEI